MEKMTIKVTLSSRNPAEAELIRILNNVGNRAAYMKLAAFHYHNILGKLSRSHGPGDDVRQHNTDRAQPENDEEGNINFADAFDDIPWMKEI